MSLYKDGEIWYLSIVHNGKRIRRSTGTSSKKAAEEYHDKVKADLWRDEKLGEKYATWGQAAAAWLAAEKRDESDCYRERALSASIGINTSLRTITAATLDTALAGKGNANKIRYLNLATAILNLAKRKGWLDTVPTFERPKVTKGRLRWLTKDEWTKLQDALEQVAPHLLPLAQFSIATGLRENNVLELEWSQVDMKRKVCWVHPDQAKARKAIGIPLSNDAMRVLRERRGMHEQWVFAYGETPLTRTSNHGWKSAREKAGIKGFTWHGLRHTWASWHVMAGTPLPVLQKLGGWESYAMVLRYAHLASDHLAGYANNAKSR